MNSLLIYPIALPLVAGLICLLLPKRVRYVREILCLGVSIATLAAAISIYQQGALNFQMNWFTVGPYLQVSIDLLTTPLAKLGVMAGAIFAILICIYSWEFMRDKPAQGLYYAGLMAALGASCGVLLSNNFILFLFCWEIVGIMLYMLVMISDPEAAPAAGKALIIAVTGDMALLLGVAFIWLEKGSLTISDLAANPLVLNTPLSMAAFGLLLAAAMAKAGVIPLHSWLPAISTHTHMPVLSFFTSLDKLIGIYLLASLSLFWFVMTPQVGMLLMILGAVSLLAGVLMAMVQHDFRKMLAFHNVSQVGYMVLGIGTGTALGIVGGLFHLVNMLVLKGSLFLCGGSVQRQTGRTEFGELGGLAKSMPWTFAGTLVAALGISGIPPLNAFVSKWMIYQGIISQGSGAFPVFLMVAMFGSALTLASFMKLMYSIFWGSRPEGLEQVKESGAAILTPIVFLALAAIGFGVFYFWPTDLLAAALGPLTSQAAIPGFWDSGLAAILLIVSLLAGLPIYWLSRTRQTREAEVFLGGETMDSELYRVPGSHFYGPVKEFGGLKQLFALGEKGAFDLYNYTTRGDQLGCQDHLPLLRPGAGRLLPGSDPIAAIADRANPARAELAAGADVHHVVPVRGGGLWDVAETCRHQYRLHRPDHRLRRDDRLGGAGGGRERPAPLADPFRYQPIRVRAAGSVVLNQRGSLVPDYGQHGASGAVPDRLPDQPVDEDDRYQRDERPGGKAAGAFPDLHAGGAVVIRIAAVRQLLQQIPAGRGSRADQPVPDHRDHRDGAADAGIFVETDPEVLEAGVTYLKRDHHRVTENIEFF